MNMNNTLLRNFSNANEMETFFNCRRYYEGIQENNIITVQDYIVDVIIIYFAFDFVKKRNSYVGV